MQEANVIETEFEWLLYHLRSSTTKLTAPAFEIANTVIMRGGMKPVAWYYSTADGNIRVRRKAETLSLISIVGSFI